MVHGDKTMKIKSTDGTEIVLALKGRHMRKVIKKVSELSKEKGEASPAEVLGDMADVFEEILKDATGLTEKDIDNLEIDTLNKLLETIKEKCFASVGFPTP